MDFSKWQKYRNSIAAAFVVMLAVFFVGYYLGKDTKSQEEQVSGLINQSVVNGPSNVDFAPFWEVWNILNQKYVPTNGTTTVPNNQTRVYGAIEGMVASLGDPYTVFFPPVENQSF